MPQSIRAQLAPAQDEAKKFLDNNGHKPKLFSKNNFLEFFSNIPGVTRMIWDEPEILIFVLLQWVVICLAYFAWIQILQWIPDQTWNAIQQANEHDRRMAFDLVNLAMLAWSFLIVGVASYPIAVCNAAIIAVHDLRSCNESVTITKCLEVATRHLGRMWVFTFTDAWITVRAILRRLPKKRGKNAVVTAVDEVLYYAWKVATLGVMPSLVNGRSFLQAGKDSVLLLTSQPRRAIGLRSLFFSDQIRLIFLKM